MPAPEAVRLAREWLDYARQDLSAAEIASSDRRFEPRHVGWHAQQAAEKAIKAVLVLQQIGFPFIHDLETLRELVPASYEIRRADLRLDPLSEWAVEHRYPGDPSASEADADQAVALAARVLELVERDFDREAAG